MQDNWNWLCLWFQLLQAVNTQAAKAQQSKMQASKKSFKDGTAASEDVGSSARPPSPNTAQLPVSKSSLSEPNTFCVSSIVIKGM